MLIPRGVDIAGPHVRIVCVSLAEAWRSGGGGVLLITMHDLQCMTMHGLRTIYSVVRDLRWVNKTVVLLRACWCVGQGQHCQRTRPCMYISMTCSTLFTVPACVIYHDAL